MEVVVIKRNEETRGKWDLDEDNNFIDINGYKVNAKRKGNVYTASYLLELIDLYIHTLIGFLYKYIHENGKEEIPEVKLLFTTDHDIQEIVYNKGFHGINKPKDIYKSTFENKKKLFKKDNQYRAGRRLIMLELRDSEGNFLPWEKIKETLLHELGHTMCNHIVYREEGNHEDDFYESEAILKKVAEISNDNADLDRQIIDLLGGNSS